MTKTPIGKNVKYLRQYFGLTQVELAKFAGTTGANISQIENGTHWPNLKTVIGISETLSVSLDRLVYGSKALEGK